MGRTIWLFLFAVLWALPALAQGNSANAPGQSGNANSNAGGQNNNGNGNGNGNSQQTAGETITIGGGGSAVRGNRPVINIQYLDDGNLDVAMELNAGCGTQTGLCVSGEGYLDLLMWGNRRAVLRVRPDAIRAINNRTLGLFRYDTNPGATVPDVLYDVRLEVVDAALGASAFSQSNVLSPGIINLSEYTSFPEEWRAVADLRRGAKLVRVYFQPLFEATEADIFAAPGDYSASIRLSIIQR